MADPADGQVFTAAMLARYSDGAWSTYTPTVVGSSGGTITSYTASCRWQRIGRLITATYSITIPTAGTAAGAALIALPTNAATADRSCGAGRDSNNGAALIAFINGSTSQTYVSLITTANASPIHNGAVISFSVTYEAAS